MIDKFGITFANPSYFVFLVLWCAILLLTFYNIIWRKKALQKLKVFNIPGAFTAPKWRTLKTTLSVLGYLFLVIALIGPQWGQKENPIKAQGLDLCFAIDLSRSMLAEDVLPNRLQSSKNQLSIFMGRMAGDRASLVGFAGSAFVAAPLTTDYHAILSFLDPMIPSYISDQSTNLSVGVDACLNSLGLEEVKDRIEIEDLAAKVVVLVTDGEETGSDFNGAVARAEKLGVPVYTFAVGTAKGGLIPIRSERGVQYLKDPSNPSKNVITKLEDKVIKEVAGKTGGKIFYLTNGVDAWKEFEEALANYKRDSVEAGTRLDREDRFQWPLLIAFLFLLLDFFLPEAGRIFRKGSLGSIILFLLLTPSAKAEEANLMPWTIYKNNKGVDKFFDGELSDSRLQFEDALADRASDLRLRFNWAATRFAMALPKAPPKGEDGAPPASNQEQQINEKVVNEALKEFLAIEKDYLKGREETPKDDIFLKSLKFEQALAHEILKEKTKGLQAFYRAQTLGPEEEQLDGEIEEGIKRLLSEPPADGGGGGGGGQDDPKDGESKDGEGKGDKKDQNPKYGQGQKKPEFKGTDVDKEQAAKILESVGSKERDVQMRKAQQNAEEQQQGKGKQDGQSFGRGKQW
ncbi:VWA domain-containing protein [bacterium]|nr:VWA domain-containing protein [bacterium]